MRRALQWKLGALLFATLLIGAAAGAMAARMLGSVPLAIAWVSLIGLLPVMWVTWQAIKPLRKLLRALTGAVASYRDGDFSFSLIVDRQDELGELLALHNALGHALQEHHSQLAQRELLLQTITQNSPVALVLVDNYQRVAYANLAAAQLLNQGRSLLGQDFAAVLKRGPEALLVAASAGEDCVFSAKLNGNEETLHLSQRSFRLQTRLHTLYLLRCVTRELSRQEVATWKKLIRVLSHELNNSLAPIASLAQSGAELLRRSDPKSLSGVFEAINERADHLHRFLSGYAEFARLPSPRPQAVQWNALVDAVTHQYPARIAGELPADAGWFDRSQLEHALINLLKNAHEAGGPPDEIELEISQNTAELRFDVRDRGPGMSDVVMAQALLPFYSTKRSGTGLGLALAREIAEAHGGHVRLTNRTDGGLIATLVLPAPRERSLNISED